MTKHSAPFSDIPSAESGWRSQSPTRNGVCPYVVIRHDEDLIPDNEKEAILEAVYIECVPDHGCADCWRTISLYDLLGPLPTNEEKVKYLDQAKQRESGVQSYAEAEKENAGVAGIVGGKATSTGTANAEQEGESSGVKRKRDDEKEVKQEQDADFGIDGEREAKKPRKETLFEPNNDVQIVSPSLSPAITFTQASTSALSSPTSSPLTSPRLPSPEPQDAASTTAVEEVIPPPPWHRGKSQSTAYSIFPSGNGRNWDFDNDKLFRGITLKIDSSQRRKTTSRSPEVDPLEANRAQHAPARVASMHSKPSFAEQARDMVKATAGLSPEDRKKKELEMKPQRDALLTHLQELKRQHKDCEQCGDRLGLVIARYTAFGSGGGLLCSKCQRDSNNDEAATNDNDSNSSTETKDQPKPLPTKCFKSQVKPTDVPGTSISEVKVNTEQDNTAWEESTLTEQQKEGSVPTAEVREVRPGDDSLLESSGASVESSLSDLSDSGLSTRANAGSSPETPADEIEIELLRKQVKTLQVELLEMRGQNVALLEDKALAADREAKLLKKVNEQAAAEIEYLKVRREGDRWICAQKHSHNTKDRALQCRWPESPER